LKVETEFARKNMKIKKDKTVIVRIFDLHQLKLLTTLSSFSRRSRTYDIQHDLFWADSVRVRKLANVSVVR
jgi:hypothetical protein